MNNRKERIESITDKVGSACAHWFHDDYAVYVLSSDSYKYGCHRDEDTLQSYLDMLRDDALETIDTQFDEIVAGCKSFTEFYRKLGNLGLLKIEPEIVEVGGGKCLRLRHNRYLAEFRGYAYQVSGDAFEQGDYGRSYLPMQRVIQWLDYQYPVWEDFIELAHATAAACEYREFRSLLHSRSPLILDLIGAKDGAVFDLVRWGTKTEQGAKKLNIMTAKFEEPIAHLVVGERFVCIETNGFGSYYVEMPADFEKPLLVMMKEVIAQFLLSMCGVVLVSRFRVEKKAKLQPTEKLDAPCARNIDQLHGFIENT